MYPYRKKLILITGASSGIGRATAIAFSNEKMKIALIGKNEDRLRSISNIINDQSQSVAKIFPFDLRKTDEIPNLVKEVELVFDETVDMLINAAGITTLGYVEDVPMEEYYNIFNINFFSSLALIQAVIPGMKEKISGQIINITSGAGVRGLPGSSSYCATKFALNGLTESLRVELKPFGIKVLLFSPGPTKTRLMKNQKVFGDLKEVLMPLKMNNPKYIAKRILKASKLNTRHVEVSYRSKIAQHLNYWVPSLFDKVLEKSMKRDI